MIHEDDRRILEDFAEGKILTLKKDATVGKHYHNVKQEIFYLVKGGGTMVLDGVESEFKLNEPVVIEPGIRHEFHLKAGSVLLGFCSHPYNPADDVRY